MKTKNKNFIRNNYYKSWSYIKESKNFIYAVAAIFFFFVFIGFFIPTPEIISAQILSFIKELIEKTEGMSQIELTNFIFLNNLQSSFFGLVFGIIFGLFPIITAVI